MTAAPVLALFPVVARYQIAGGPAVYGLLLARSGRVRRRRFRAAASEAASRAGRIVVVGVIGTAAALILFGLARQPPVALVASVLAGISWIWCWPPGTSRGSRSARLGRGRGLSIFVAVMFGSLTLACCCDRSPYGRAFRPPISRHCRHERMVPLL